MTDCVANGFSFGRLSAAAVSMLALSAVLGAADAVDHKVSVRELMVSAVTPATNTLWGADNPQSDETWQALEDAAVVVIAAGTLMKDGGAGQEDDSWASDPAWQAFADTMIAAAVEALRAARARDVDSLMTATEVMYPPCEECHLKFHPDL